MSIRDACHVCLLENSQTEIWLSKSSGFCFGVEKAVNTAYDLAEKSAVAAAPTFMLGEITHNEVVVSDLLEKGLCLADDVSDVADESRVLIRAHGIAPIVRESLEQKGCEVFDCTCPFVHKIHRIVRAADDEGKNVIIVGKKGHPEVDGLCGECQDHFVVISSIEEAENMQFEQKTTVLVSQTTFSSNDFDKISEIIKNKIANLQIFDTICSTTANRQREAADLAASADRMIVIGSGRSSNTMKLFDICRSYCADTYLVMGSEDMVKLLPSLRMGERHQVIGITAGASTPECNIREVIRVMSENETVSNQEQVDINFGDYIDNIPQLRKNAIVKGAITSADNEFVYVDVHDKSEGRIPRHEFANEQDFDLDAAIAEHREIDVFVRSVRNSDMGKEILLSKTQVDYGKYKTLIEEAYTTKTPMTVKITSVVKDGVIASMGGVDVYIHRTQLEMSNVEDLDAYKGKEIEILITQFDPDKRRLRVSGSRRTLLSQEKKAKAEELWNTIEIGAEYDGIVRSLTDFGAFVDIGGVDGLVHVSELSWNRIRHPSEVLKTGDIVHVFVKDFDPAKRRISLGYRRPEDDPYHNIEDRFPVGSIVEGKVVRMFQFGAFVELAEGVDALCHVSQISNVRLNKPDEALSEDMIVTARVLDVNSETRRISISIRDVAPIDPEPVQTEDETEDVATSDYVSEDVSAFQSAPVVVTEDASVEEAVEETAAIEEVAVASDIAEEPIEVEEVSEVVEEATAIEEAAEETETEA